MLGWWNGVDVASAEQVETKGKSYTVQKTGRWDVRTPVTWPTTSIVHHLSAMGRSEKLLEVGGRSTRTKQVPGSEF